MRTCVHAMGCSHCNPGVGVAFGVFVPLYAGGVSVFVAHVEVWPPPPPPNQSCQGTAQQCNLLLTQ